MRLSHYLKAICPECGERLRIDDCVATEGKWTLLRVYPCSKCSASQQPVQADADMRSCGLFGVPCCLCIHKKVRKFRTA